MSGRELVILLLGLAIIAVVLRGLFVALQARRGQIRLAIDKNIPLNVDLDALELAELPSGGARVVERSLQQVNSQNSALEVASARAAALNLGDGQADADPIPVLMEAVELTAQPVETESEFYQDEGGSDSSGFNEQRLDNESGDDLEDDPDSILFDYPEDDEPGLGVDEDQEDSDPLQRVAPDYPDDVDNEYDEISAEDRSESDADELTERNDAPLEYAEDLEEDDYVAYTDATETGEEAYANSEIESEDQELAGDPSEQRQDTGRGSVTEFGEGSGEFSMTAGERIGYDNRSEQDQQTTLFDATEKSVEAEPKSKRRSLFSAFRRKPKSAATDKGIAEVEDAPVDFEEPIEELEQTFDSSIIEDEHKPGEPAEVIVVNVMAGEGYVFAGGDLLQVLITSGLKFGEMNIFHQRLDSDNKGPVVFSVANILNPGTFDLNSMEEFTTLGISLFLALPAPTNNLEAFEQMLDVAQQICEALDGELRDDNRNIMTAQTIEHYRQRIRDFELCQPKAAGSHG